MGTALQLSPRKAELDPAEALVAAGAAAWRWDLGSPCVEWSAGAVDVLGLPEVVLHSPDLITEMVDPDDLALARAAAGSWRSGQRLGAQIRIRFDGRVRWLDVAGRVVDDERGAPYATGTVRDVTEAREAQDALLDALHASDTALNHLTTLVTTRVVPAVRYRVA